MMHPYGHTYGSWPPPPPPYGMPVMSQAIPRQNVPTTPKRICSPVEPSSDPPDPNVPHPYPLIEDFFNGLDVLQPVRHITYNVCCFAANDYYYIDELLQLTKAELMADGFGYTAGNAKFILEQVDYEMRRIEHGLGIKRRHARATK